MSHRRQAPGPGEILGTALLVAMLFLIMMWGSKSFPAHHESKNELAAGTDMFWELHDRHFPTHYLQDGRVTCTEEQAAKELEKLGWIVER